MGRALPATKAMPKEMLPLIDKPVIQYVVEEAIASGITDIILVTSHAKRAVEDHFDESPLLELWLKQQGKRMAYEGSDPSQRWRTYLCSPKRSVRERDTVLNAAHLINDEPFAVVFGDDVYTGKVPRLKQMMDVFTKYQDPVLGVVKVDRSETKRYGIVDPLVQVEKRVYQCRDVVEKPLPEHALVFGC